MVIRNNVAAGGEFNTVLDSGHIESRIAFVLYMQLSCIHSGLAI